MSSVESFFIESNTIENRYAAYLNILNNYYKNTTDDNKFVDKLNDLILYLRKLNILLYKE